MALSHSKLFASSTAMAIILSNAAYADVSAEDVWANLQDISGLYGRTLIAGSKSYAGGKMVLSDVSVSAKVEGAEREGSIEMIELQERGDGTVSITLSPEIPAMLNKGEMIPLAGGSYVLIELPFQRLPLHWEQILFEVAGRGFKILIAHPERCAQLAQQPMLVERLLETGVYLQVNWTSLLGYHGKLVQKTAHHLARSGAIHCMATDSHNTRERSALIVRRGAEELAALVGRKNLALLTVENPARVLNGNDMAGMDVNTIPHHRASGSGWRRIFSFFQKG